ncbi:SNR48 protein, partial [Amia calva]|nr:SNR48 protein [Amia calva]
MCDLPVNGELSETVQSRLHDLADLSGFAERCQHTLTGLLQCLGWSQDFNKDRTQEEPTQLCPCDANHRVPRSSLDEHLLSCRLRHMGYSRQEQDEMYDPSVCYEKARVPSVIMDTELQQQIILQARADAPPERTEGLYSQSEYSSEPAEVPQNHKHAVCDLTVADRLALYNHVSRETGRQRSQAELAENEDLYVDLAAKLKRDDDQNGPKSHLEVLAEMRDYKRRRQSYRAKNVHITKKSYTEVSTRNIYIS